MDFASGQQIGTYRVIRLLGKGGMGAVYEVEHVQLGVRYALKTFTLEGRHVEVLKNKFLTEGKILARLHEPNLVRVFDLNFDEATGTPYFVMDLVLSNDGTPRTLAEINTAELDEDLVFQWFVELAAAVDYIHEQGIIHRDIKLGNVLLSAENHVVLSDFGVSRLFSEQLRTDVNAVRTMVSEVGTVARLVMGTQGYMAPEVACGEEATPAADAYSLGVMFVYLLTGIWYEPGSKVFKLLETLEYRWNDVLPRLLSENPLARPVNLLKLSELLRSDPVADHEDFDDSKKKSPWWMRCRVFVLAGLLLFAVIVSVFFAVLYSHRSTPAAADDFSEAFGVRGIYEDPRLQL